MSYNQVNGTCNLFLLVMGFNFLPLCLPLPSPLSSSWMIEMGGGLLSPFPFGHCFYHRKGIFAQALVASFWVPQGVQSRLFMCGAHPVWAGSALKICCVSRQIGGGWGEGRCGRRFQGGLISVERGSHTHPHHCRPRQEEVSMEFFELCLSGLGAETILCWSDTDTYTTHTFSLFNLFTFSFYFCSFGLEEGRRGKRFEFVELPEQESQNRMYMEFVRPTFLFYIPARSSACDFLYIISRSRSKCGKKRRREKILNQSLNFSAIFNKNMFKNTYLIRT